MSKRSRTLFVLVLQSLLLVKELAISWVSCSVYIGVSMHAFSGQKSREGFVIHIELCWETSSYHRSCWLRCGQPPWVNQVHGWEASLQWCKGGEWYGKTLHGNNSLCSICTTLYLVCLLSPGLFPHDLPFIVAVSVGNLPLYKVPHWNMWSGYSSLGMTDKGTERTQVCREVRVVD